MKRVAVSFVLSAAAAVAATGVAAAAEYPKSDFQGKFAHGHTGGTITWYNRAVGVSGFVMDEPAPGSTAVLFQFRGPNGELYDAQTRTVSDDYRKFGWAQPGPAGGIARVDVYLVHDRERHLVESLRRKA
ncbi:hypothetical protein [Amycolatopsis benzoatilytica]|uniref:hypothetical protein n=1 Tax=Amycolatopsis benzoatilytica TaxID=346045 RepID=UPI0003780532|nr:hypothetical protein [Amycolatopsis benzoatilytica]